MENVLDSIRSVWKVLIQVLEGFRVWKGCAQIFFACIVPKTLLGITPGLILEVQEFGVIPKSCLVCMSLAP